MSKKQSWSSFSHHLKGSGFSTPQRSLLYKKYKSGDIKESELDFPNQLGQHLGQTKLLKSGFSGLKSRLLKYFKNFEGFPEAVAKYLKDNNYYKQSLDYVKRIQKDLEDEIDYIIEVLEKYNKKVLDHKIDYEASYYDYIIYLRSLASFGEPELATKIFQELTMSSLDAYKDLESLYKHFPELFDKSVGRFKIGDVKRDGDKKFNGLVLEFFKMASEAEVEEEEDYDDLERYDLSGYSFLIAKLASKGAIVMVDDFLQKFYQGAENTNKFELNRIRTEFADQYVKYDPKFREKVTTALKNLGNSSIFMGAEFLSDLDEWNPIKISISNLLKTAEECKPLNREIEKLKLENKRLKEEIIHLKYRPGGPGFESAKLRQIGKYGIKR